jgi:hypothetical protein
MEISENDAKLRFWRNTDLAKLGFWHTRSGTSYVTAEGYLGYEWDVFSDNCHTPKGLFFLSGTTKVLTKVR